STLAFTPRIKAYFGKPDNDDYAHYAGHVDWKLRWAQDNGLVLTGLYRQGTEGRNAMQFEAAWPLQRTFLNMHGYLPLQYYKGYGETLLGYNQKSSGQVRLGLALVPEGAVRSRHTYVSGDGLDCLGLRQGTQHLVWRERSMAEPFSGGIKQGVGNGGRCRHRRRFAGSHGRLVLTVEQQHLDGRNIGERNNGVRTPFEVDHTFGVERDFFLEGATEHLNDVSVNLVPDAIRIHHHTGI